MVGCSEIDSMMSGFSEKRITLSVQMPTEDNTRVSLTQAENSKDLIARWQEDDEVQVFFRQDNNVYEGGKVKVTGISQDGKSASLNLDLPGMINQTKPFFIYCFTGIDGQVRDVDNGVWYPYCRMDVTRSLKTKFKAPMFAQVDVPSAFSDGDFNGGAGGGGNSWENGGSSQEGAGGGGGGSWGAVNFAAHFKHIGTYEVLHLKNTSTKKVSVVHCGFETKLPWYQDYAGVDLVDSYDYTKLPSEWDGDNESPALEIPAGTEGVFLSSYMPSGFKVEDAQLVTRIDGVVVKSSNKKSSNVSIQRRHAYHMYATWDGKELKLDQGDALWGELQLSTYSVQIPVGGDVEIQILNGSMQQANLKFDIPDDVVTEPSFTGNASFKLHANKVGHTTVTVTDNVEMLRAIIEIQVADNVSDIPADVVDLDLPSGILWASYNVGATKPEEYGGHYAYGEVEEKEVYNWNTYLYCDGSKETLRELGDICGTQYDVAQVKWGGNWRMPTLEDINELFKNTNNWCGHLNEVFGMFFEGKNGNSIFLPAAGLYVDDIFYNKGYSGEYWQVGSFWSSVFGDVSSGSLWFAASGINGMSGRDECYGLSVRPVRVNGLNYPKISLSAKEVYVDVGAETSFDVLSGSGRYAIINEFADKVDVKVEQSTNGTWVVRVKGNSEGLASVTIRDVMTCKLASFKVRVTKVINSTPSVAVDLGLSVKWASYNIGATKPEEPGGYYSWGEMDIKNLYNSNNYEYYDSSNKVFRNIGSNICGTQYDIAHVKWGGGWRLPTLDEIKELNEKCTFVWSVKGGTLGCSVIGPNGNSIFLPISPDFDDDPHTGNYWTGTIGDSERSAYAFRFYKTSNDGMNTYIGSYVRYSSYSVRPVTK